MIEIRCQVRPKQLKSLLWCAFAVEISFAILFLFSQMDGMPITIVELFNLDGEISLPTWLSATQLFLMGLTFLLWSYLSQGKTLVSNLFLLCFGLGFIFLSADEAAVIHERLTGIFQPVDWLPRFKGDRGLWIPMYLTAAFLFLVKFRRDLQHLWKTFPQHVRIIALGILLFLFGAVGVEILNYQFQLEEMANQWPHTIQIFFEELFEMAGASIMLYGIVRMALDALALQEPSAFKRAPLSQEKA